MANPTFNKRDIKFPIPAHTNVSLNGNPNNGTVLDFTILPLLLIYLNEYNGEQFRVEKYNFQ